MRMRVRTWHIHGSTRRQACSESAGREAAVSAADKASILETFTAKATEKGMTADAAKKMAAEIKVPDKVSVGAMMA